MRGSLLRIVALCIPILLFLMCELALRATYPEKVIIPSSGGRGSFVFNPDYLISMKPSTEGTFTRFTKEGRVVTHWNTNANGFRGKELRDKKDQRIIVYGDSNVFASSSDLENTFTYQLEKELERLTHKDIEVVNAGIIGFGPDQSLLRFESDVDRYRPDLVVFHVFADNDFGDIIRNRLFDIDASGSLIRTTHPITIDPCLSLRYTPCPPAASLIDTLNDRASFLVTYQALRRVLKTVKLVKAPGGNLSPDMRIQNCLETSDAEYAVYQRSAPRAFSHFADHYDCDEALFPDRESSIVKVRLMDAVLTRAKQVAELKRVKFMVLIEPSTSDLTTNTRLNYRDLAKFSGYKPTNLSGAIEKILGARRMAGLNLFETFSKNHPGTLFFDVEDDNHWNETGQLLAARETARYIDTHWPEDHARR